MAKPYLPFPLARLNGDIAGISITLRDLLAAKAAGTPVDIRLRFILGSHY